MASTMAAFVPAATEVARPVPRRPGGPSRDLGAEALLR